VSRLEQFVPDVRRIPPFEACVRGTHTVEVTEVRGLDEFDTAPVRRVVAAESGGPAVSLSDETVRAGAILDSVLKNLTDNFSSAADYFKVRVASGVWTLGVPTACVTCTMVARCVPRARCRSL
jgi:hypothetical protein